MLSPVLEKIKSATYIHYSVSVIYFTKQWFFRNPAGFFFYEKMLLLLVMDYAYCIHHTLLSSFKWRFSIDVLV